MTSLELHSYRYFPYEASLARRELAALSGLPVSHLLEQDQKLLAPPSADSRRLQTLTYFSHFEKDGRRQPTTQHLLETIAKDSVGRKSPRRQSTRYSTHGIHDYKGKFNPQIAASLLAMMGADKKSKVFDPFCGSGTCLVEAEHKQIPSVGADLNPLAVLISRTKLELLSTSSISLRESADRLLDQFVKERKRFKLPLLQCERGIYLRSWFEEPYLSDIECLRELIEQIDGVQIRNFMSVMVSDLLIDYSCQEPADLRIRRRKSPYPAKIVIDALAEKIDKVLTILSKTQELIRRDKTCGQAHVADSRREDDLSFLHRPRFPEIFSHVITSPPYATALPYVDTQRLSLVWLALIKPSEILRNDAALVGSREIRGESRNQIHEALRSNSAELPREIHRFCLNLREALGEDDGFRRQAVPGLLYRYYGDMFRVMKNLFKLLKPNGLVAMVVGGNQTTLGGTKFTIRTPEDLATLGEAAGFTLIEMIPLQTYHRYGMHSQNSVKTESIVMLRK